MVVQKQDSFKDLGLHFRQIYLLKIILLTR